MTNKKCEGIDCAWCMSIECPTKESKMADKEQVTNSKEQANDSLKNQSENFNENSTQEKEQIIIDGVDVSECGYFYIRPNNRAVCCTCHVDCHCAANPNCYFKQLARKTQECEELKNIIAYPKYRNEIAIKELENKTKKELIEEIVHRHQIGESTVHCVYTPLREENNRYRKALEEIERELKEDIYCESQECGCDDYEECLRCTKNIILDIINKAKGNNHEADKD